MTHTVHVLVVDLDGREHVGRGRLRAHHVLGRAAPDVREGDGLVVLARLGGRRPRRLALRLLRSLLFRCLLLGRLLLGLGLPLVDVGQDVGTRDAPTLAGATDLTGVEIVFGDQLADDRREHLPGAATVAIPPLAFGFLVLWRFSLLSLLGLLGLLGLCLCLGRTGLLLAALGLGGSVRLFALVLLGLLLGRLVFFLL